jgi:DNA-binding CsgD family transcriptional regulator
MQAVPILLPERVFLERDESSKPFARLLELINGADSVEALRSGFVPAAKVHFEAARGAIFLFEEMPLARVPFAIWSNPVVRYVLDRHAPVHEGFFADSHRWEAICTRNDHGHALTGPVVREGKVIGALAFTRNRGEAAFGEAELADVSACCLHLSAWFSRWEPEKESAMALTARERRIVALVGEGLTNAEIAGRLLVSKETVKAALKGIFRKTGVRSRVQLVGVDFRK